MLEKSHPLSVMNLFQLLLHFKFLSVLLSQAINERAAEMLSLTVWPWHFALTFYQFFTSFVCLIYFIFQSHHLSSKFIFFPGDNIFFLFQGVTDRYDEGKLIYNAIINQLQLNPSFLM